MIPQQSFVTKYFLNFAIGYYISFIKDNNPVTQAGDQVKIMRGYNLRYRKTAQQLYQCPFAARVKAAGGFVQCQYFGIQRQYGSYSHPLFLPNTEMMR